MNDRRAPAVSWVMASLACITCVAVVPTVARGEAGIDAGLDAGRDGAGADGGGMDAPPTIDASSSIDANSDAPGCGAPPGTICDGMCWMFPCGDPVCSRFCGTTCYDCVLGAWRPRVTDCFCFDANVDASRDASIDAITVDAPRAAASTGACACRVSRGSRNGSFLLAALVASVAAIRAASRRRAVALASRAVDARRQRRPVSCTVITENQRCRTAFSRTAGKRFSR